MTLEIFNQDLTGYPVVLNNGLAVNKTGVSILIKPQILNGDLELNITKATFAGLSLFGAVRNKANSIILDMLSQYHVKANKINGNIVINIPQIIFDNIFVNNESIVFEFNIKTV